MRLLKIKMSPLPATEKPPADADSPNWWRFTWEAQSHTSVLRLLLFNPTTKPSAQCRDLKISLLPQQSLLTVSFLESGSLMETLVRVPVPRVLVDPESPIHFKVLEDHIEVKLVLLLPVDHPLVSDFDSILSVEENGDEIRPFSLDSDIQKLSCMEEVHFYCRSCSNKLTKGLRCFKEMPSVNWREVADNWFGNCCCSFGGVSEKMVAEYAKSYTCSSGVCLLNNTSVLLCKNDFLGCEFLDMQPRQNSEPDLNSPGNNCLGGVSLDEAQVRADSCVNHREGLVDVDITEDKITASSEHGNSKTLVDDDSLSCTFCALRIEQENKALKEENSQNCDIGHCCHGALEPSSNVPINEGNVELLDNQKVFLDGYLGNGFMVRSSGLSKDIRWIEFLCPQCSCLVGAYPCFDDNVPLDGGVRLFKCHISTCLPVNGSSDAFRNYTLERMFASQLLESAEDELSFRTIVRDMQTKSPVLQIVLLNPNTWGCAGSLRVDERAAKLVMRPSVKLLFSASSHGVEFDSRTVGGWVRKNQADEIYMFSSQILELVRILEVSNSQYPSSCSSLQGLFLSSMRR